MLRRTGHGKSVDWYLLGVLLYECITGKTPYFAKTKEMLYQNILYGNLIIPRYVSEKCKDLLSKLLHRNASKRLGSGPNGAKEIKDHPFFNDINWQDVRDKKI